MATVYGFLKRFGLENEVKVNVEQGHAILAGHSFEHELAMARTLGIFGSIDMNRNDYQSGWDTDQFPNSPSEAALAYYEVLMAGGFTTGGTNFDAKLRRQSLDPEDLIASHAGAMDICARGLKSAWRMIEDDALEGPRRDRYAGWESDKAKAMLADGATLDGIAADAETRGVNPQPRSGAQEKLENIVNRYV
ncbi:Xylose isomerase (plasmid) [Sulfitobacter sp. THAF37]|nr:Xylose isomerase [Sulfitobacter sp. THAF37]